jgi:hypothetical protein
VARAKIREIVHELDRGDLFYHLEAEFIFAA